MKILGMILIVIGAAWLLADYLLGLTQVNVLLVAPLLLMIAGTLIHVRALKRESSY